MGDTANSQRPKLDPTVFTKRLHTFINNWQDSRKIESLWENADGISIVLGKPTDDDPPYRKTSSLHNWLLGYEFPETILVFCERELFVLASQKKIQILEPLQKGMVDEKSNLKLTCLTINQEDGNKANFATLINALKASRSGQVVGALPKEKMEGALATNWEAALKESNLKQVDVRSGLADIFAHKDPQEIALIKQAADISAKIMERKLISTIEEHIDQGTEITHNQLAEQMDELLDDSAKLAELLKNPKLASEGVEACYTPIIQSGGKYNLSVSATNNNEPLHSGTIVCSVGARYRSYCANVARTLFVDPKKEVEQNYKHLIDIFNAVIKALKVGNKMSQAMEEAAKVIQKQCPQLSNNFLKTCGSGIGIEFSEIYGALSSKNTRPIKLGMVFNVTVGFNNIELQGATDPKNKVYSLLLSDTVLVADGGPDVLTKSCNKDFGDISYSLEEPEATPKPPPKAAVKKERPPHDERKSGPFGNEARRVEKGLGFRNDEEIKKHQDELAKRLAMKRGNDWGNQNTSAPREKDVNAYPDPAAFPAEAQKNKVYVDVKRKTVLIPIYGCLVPFHITKIKNASKAEDMLRINFSVPNISIASGAYIKEISIRVGDQKSLNNNLRLIKELRKRVQDKEKTLQMTSNLVEQPKLILSKQRQARLMDLYVRPNISGRRTAGVLELHTNGFRFITNKNIAVDILYSNIKHAFFQPSESELIILLHFHLHNEIMIGKKKVPDIQFYAEVIDGARGLDSGSRAYDRDEIEDEQREAEIRAKLDREFQNFIKKAEDMSSANNTDIEFDIPYRELGFFGVPARSSVFLQPTVHCLVSLVETPFFVLSLNELEICHCERVQFGLRHFDIVLVHKDLKTVSKVNNVPMESLETIKEWLDSCNIKFYEGPTNLNWQKILSTIREDPEKFYEDGAWSFLEDNTDDGDEESSEEEESDFEVESEASGASSGSDSEDYESEPSEEEDSDDEDEEDEDEEEEGEDWDELDRKAAAHDKMRGAYDDDVPTNSKRKRGGEYSDDESDKPKKKAASAPGGGGGRGGGGGGKSGTKGGTASKSSASSKSNGRKS